MAAAFIGAAVSMIVKGFSSGASGGFVGNVVPAALGAAGGAAGGAIGGVAAGTGAGATGTGVGAGTLSGMGLGGAGGAGAIAGGSSVGGAIGGAAPAFTSSLLEPIANPFLSSAASSVGSSAGPTLANAAAQGLASGATDSFWSANAGQLLNSGVKLAGSLAPMFASQPEIQPVNAVAPPLLPPVREQTRDFEKNPAQLAEADYRRKTNDRAYAQQKQADELANIETMLNYQRALEKTGKGKLLTPTTASQRFSGTPPSQGGYI